MNQINSANKKREYKKGIGAAILCALLWGVLPIYWKLLRPINPLTIMLYRILLLCLLVFVIDLFFYKWKGIITPLKQKGAIRVFLLAGAVISFNWGLYIYMVNAGFVIQTSIGYYIEPLVICIFGIVFFKETLEKYKLAAFLIACAGVGVMLLSYGEIPVMALCLAISFAVYAGIKKKLQATALLSLFYETVFLLPVVIPVIIYLELTGNGIYGVAEPRQIGILCLAGVVTAVPLSLFSMAANRISMVALGITEYLSPSMGLILGIFVFHEGFDLYQFLGFCLIWLGLAVFTVGGIRDSMRNGTRLIKEGTENIVSVAKEK